MIDNKLVELCGITTSRPDGIPSDFLFNLRQTIFWSFWFIFWKSFDKGIFPTMIKLSCVFPLLKLVTHEKLRIITQL